MYLQKFPRTNERFKRRNSYLYVGAMSSSLSALKLAVWVYSFTRLRYMNTLTVQFKYTGICLYRSLAASIITFGLMQSHEELNIDSNIYILFISIHTTLVETRMRRHVSYFHKVFSLSSMCTNFTFLQVLFKMINDRCCDRIFFVPSFCNGLKPLSG